MEVKASLRLHEERDRKRRRPEALESLPESSFAPSPLFLREKNGDVGGFL